MQDGVGLYGGESRPSGVMVSSFGTEESFSRLVSAPVCFIRLEFEAIVGLIRGIRMARTTELTKSSEEKENFRFILTGACFGDSTLLWSDLSSSQLDPRNWKKTGALCWENSCICGFQSASSIPQTCVAEANRILSGAVGYRSYSVVHSQGRKYSCGQVYLSLTRRDKPHGTIGGELYSYRTQAE